MKLIGILLILICDVVFAGEVEISLYERAKLGLPWNLSLTGKPDSIQFYSQTQEDWPASDKVTEVYLGDRMMLQREGSYLECMIPHFALEKNKFGTKGILYAEKPLCRVYPSSEYYPGYVNVTWDGGKNKAVTGLSIEATKKSGDQICVRSIAMAAKLVCKEALSEKDISNAIAFETSPNTFQQSIEYAGKSGSQVKFVYSEYIEGMAKDAFTRTFEIDLDEGNVGAFKGAIFEVIEAGNATITYKIIRHFE